MKYMFVFNVSQPSHNGPSIAEKKEKETAHRGRPLSMQRQGESKDAETHRLTKMV
jgi:hypothetical protein